MIFAIGAESRTCEGFEAAVEHGLWRRMFLAEAVSKGWIRCEDMRHARYRMVVKNDAAATNMVVGCNVFQGRTGFLV